MADPLGRLLHTLSQIYLAKMKCDREDDRQGRTHQNMSEFVYDFYLQLFGLREVAEQELHYLFTNVREYASKHPRVRLFALFCGIPMTNSLSTKHGHFNLAVHLNTVGVTNAAGEGVASPYADWSERPTGAALSREREAAIEREFISEAALGFYFKVRLCPLSAFAVALRAHALPSLTPALIAAAVDPGVLRGCVAPAGS